MLLQVVICTAPKSETNAPEQDGANPNVRGCTVVLFLQETQGSPGPLANRFWKGVDCWCVVHACYMYADIVHVLYACCNDSCTCNTVVERQANIMTQLHLLCVPGSKPVVSCTR